MLLIAGIIPIPDLPLLQGQVQISPKGLVVADYTIPCNQGTAAMISAALAVTDFLAAEPPVAVLAGDIGSGKGSKLIYQYLIENLGKLNPKVLALHYCMPDLKLIVELLTAAEQCSSKPLLLADAASMYAAKAAGIAAKFDIFTPDLSEMAFLADPEAIHPAYINKHLFEADSSKIPLLVEKAYENKGAAQNLLVKGAIDHIVSSGQTIAQISTPDVPILECIGGTGDTITGMLAAFSAAGLPFYQAAAVSAKANRTAGEYAEVTPASPVQKLVSSFPILFQANLEAWLQEFSQIC